MKEKIKSLLKFIRSFGVWDGVPLYLHFYTGRVKNIKVPGIKHPVSLRPKSSDIPTFDQVFLNNQYNLKPIQKPKVIIDGGANIGLFAIKMKNLFPETKVICIEPDPENFQMTQKNLSPYTDVFFENSGIWFKDTKLKVYDKYNSGKWGMVVEEDVVAGNINAISLNSLFEKYAIDYVDVLKLDIETSEKQLFSENYEIWLPKVKTIIIELHDWIEPGCSKPFFVAINKCLNHYNYTHFGENVIITNLDIT